MKQFSLGNAWSSGVAFVTRDAANMAILLIGLGVIAPSVIQYALMGSAMGMMNPAMMSQTALAGGAAAMAGTFLLAMLVSYVLQIGSYFGSWRLGFGPGESLGGAIVYGLICAVIVIAAFFVIGILMVIVAQAGALGALLIFVLLIPLMILVAALYTVMMAAMAVGMFIVFLFALAFGASLAQYNPAFAMTGAGGIGMLIALLIIALIFWLAVRFSCTTSVMADRKTFNLLAGMGESWRLTAANQWRIMGYLALIGVILCVAFIFVMMIMGASMMGAMGTGGVPQFGIGTAIIGMIVGIPFAYLIVLVPAGIYRELAHKAPSAEVFA